MTRQHIHHGAEILLDRGDDWRDQAACQGHDPELWFPHESETGQPAKQICGTCPVREQCLTWAIDHKQDYGIWGGLNHNQRKRLAKERAHLCQECGGTFQADPRARPKYCPDCRPAVYRRSKQMRQAKRNERRRP